MNFVFLVKIAHELISPNSAAILHPRKNSSPLQQHNIDQTAEVIVRSKQSSPIMSKNNSNKVFPEELIVSHDNDDNIINNNQNITSKKNSKSYKEISEMYKNNMEINNNNNSNELIAEDIV